ncbi:hypothetical protein DV515_00007224 [Chloebia gouldiae]|uniref:Uncharacterized protein n=1 Tax=Chloebia gouldiae TaxID=44316 RepID=A0A3L8SID2_CHLGU|nr:hypothetical protein DV515_00007224 [Chloebia gouldiae]
MEDVPEVVEQHNHLRGHFPANNAASQAHPKFCMHGYLFPMPIAVGPFPHPSYDTTAEIN